MQQQLFEYMKTESHISFSNIYSSHSLGLYFDDLESLYVVIDKESIFAPLVNPSISKNSPYHRWARYREAYAGDLVKEIISNSDLNLHTDFVLDPMCGSGSTNVACKELGIDSIGLDVNAYSVLLTNTKINDYTKKQIIEIKKTIDKIAPLNESTSKYTDVSKYFTKSNLEVLEGIASSITLISDPVVKNFFKTGWLAIVEDCSDRRKDGNGLAFSPTKVTDVLKHFKNQCLLMLSDLMSHPLPKNVFSKAYDQTALNFKEFIKNSPIDKQLGAIIFSPPYANSFDYFESYKLELVMGDYFSVDQLKSARKRLIRNFRLSNKEKHTKEFSLVEQLCDEIWEAIPKKEQETGVRDGRNRLVPNMLRCYFEDMSKVLEEGFYSLRQKGTMNIVVDQSSYIGIPIPTDLIFAQIGEDLGYQVESIIKCRKAGTSSQQLKKFPYLREVLRESIVTLKKP